MVVAEGYGEPSSAAGIEIDGGGWEEEEEAMENRRRLLLLLWASILSMRSKLTCKDTRQTSVGACFNDPGKEGAVDPLFS